MWGVKIDSSLLMPETSVLSKSSFQNVSPRESLTLSDLKKADVLKFA
jgi:hypothetical protein